LTACKGVKAEGKVYRRQGSRKHVKGKRGRKESLEKVAKHMRRQI
jgi:hypothetical protein